jgi:hypothetical protein
MTYLSLKPNNVKGMVEINLIFLFFKAQFKNKYTFKSKKKSDV